MYAVGCSLSRFLLLYFPFVYLFSSILFKLAVRYRISLGYFLIHLYIYHNLHHIIYIYIYIYICTFNYNCLKHSEASALFSEF